MNTFILLSCIILIWGLNWPLMKIAMFEIPPLWFGTIRMAIATICLSTVLILRRQFTLPSIREKYHILVIGCLQMGVYILLVNLGLHYSSVGHAAILVYSTPLWITPAAVLVFNEPFPFLKKIGLLLCALGVAFLFNPLSFDWTNLSSLLGSGLLLIASLVWAIATLFTRFSCWRTSVIELLPWQLLMGTLCLFVSALIFEPQASIQWTPSLVVLLLYFGIATAFAFWGVIEINKRLPAITSSLALLAVPLIGIFTSSLFLDEPLTADLIAAYLLMASGIVCGLLSHKTMVLNSD